MKQYKYSESINHQIWYIYQECEYASVDAKDLPYFLNILINDLIDLFGFNRLYRIGNYPDYRVIMCNVGYIGVDINVFDNRIEFSLNMNRQITVNLCDYTNLRDHFSVCKEWKKLASMVVK